MKKIILVLLLLCMECFAEGKTQIAVMDLVAQDVTPAVSATVSDLLHNNLFNTGKFVVLDRANMDKILKEQAFQKTGCTTTECAVEVGKILNVQEMVVGSVSKLGDKYYINVRLVDVESGKDIKSVMEECSSENELAQACKIAAKKLAGEEVPAAVKTGEKTAYDVAWRSALLPGWGQIDDKQDLKGYAIAGAEIIAVGATITTYFMHEQAAKDYNEAVTGADFDSLIKKEQDLDSLNKICFWSAVGVWVYGIIDPYLFGINNKKKIALEYDIEKVKMSYLIKF